MTENKKQVNMSKLDPPIICPLLSMASPQADEYADCMKEACWFYNRAMKKCVFVMMSISLIDISRRKGTSIMEKSLKQRMQSLRRRHQPQDK